MDQQRLNSFLSVLPVSLFGGVMGLCGLSFAWQDASHLYPAFRGIGSVIGVLAVLGFLLLVTLYLLKWRRFPGQVKAEVDNPVSLSFFGAVAISLLLLPGVLLPWNRQLAIVTWIAGVVLMLLFALYVLRYWLAHPKELTQVHPAWIIPVVGTLDVPIVGMQLPLSEAPAICLFFFAIGLTFTIVLLSLILARLFLQPLPEEQAASLMILTGPLALAFAGYEQLTGPDLFSAILFCSDLFLLLLLGSKVAVLPFRYPFRFNWWSVSFPLTALTTAAYRFAASHPTVPFKILFWFLLLLTTLVIAWLLSQTIYRYINRSFVEQ